MKGTLKVEPVILASAGRHGVVDGDVLHAYRNAVRVYEQDDDVTMIVGPGRDGSLLEIGIVTGIDVERPLIVHAMTARRKYLW